MCPLQKKSGVLVTQNPTITWEETTRVNKEPVKAESNEGHDPSPTLHSQEGPNK